MLDKYVEQSLQEDPVLASHRIHIQATLDPLMSPNSMWYLLGFGSCDVLHNLAVVQSCYNHATITL